MGSAGQPRAAHGEPIERAAARTTASDGPLSGGLVWPQVLDVHISTEPHVVRQIPAVMVWIFVNHDIVAIPEPVPAVADVEGGNAETKTAEPESARAAAAQPPHMAAPEAAGEMSVLPRMI